jgi:hypothetical protein
MSDFAVENRSHGNKSSSPKGKNDSSATGSNEDGGETKDDKNDNGSNSDGGGDEHTGSDSNMPEEDCGGEDKGDGQDDDKSDKSNSEKEDDKKKEEQEKVKKAEREKKEKERREELERIAKQEMSDSLAKQKEELRKKEELEKNEELKRIATLEKTLALEKKEEELRKKEDLERKEELDRKATLEKANALAKLTLDKKEEEKKKIRIEEEVRLKKVEEEKKLRISEELRLKEELERKEESERIASQERAETLEKELHKKEELEELERIAKQKLAEAETEKQLMEEEMSRQCQLDLGKKQEEIIPPEIPPETLREFDRRVHEQLQEQQKQEEIENRERGGKNNNTTASANENDFDMEVTADDGKNEEPKDGDKKMPPVDPPGVKRGRKKRKLLPKRDDTNKRDHTARDRWQPDSFRRNKRKAKKRRKIMTTPELTKLVAAAMDNRIEDENPDADNYMNKKLKHNDPLTFLADKDRCKKEWPIQGYATHQTQFSKALLLAQSALDLPTSRKAYTRIDGDPTIRTWLKSGMKDAKLEADLCMINGVKEMHWVPTERKQSIDTVSSGKTLKGYFQVKVKRYTGKIELVTVSTDWVQTNFDKAVIGQVQRTAYEKLEELECTGQNLSAKNRRGFVSVESCGVQISEIDKRVINRLKYKRGGTILGAVCENRWFGYNNEAKVSIELSTEWVEASFNKFYLMQVRSSSGESSFLKIPPGDDRN